MCACQTGRRDQYARSPISLTGAVDQLLTFILLTWTATVQRELSVEAEGRVHDVRRFAVVRFGAWWI